MPGFWEVGGRVGVHGWMMYRFHTRCRLVSPCAGASGEFPQIACAVDRHNDDPPGSAWRFPDHSTATIRGQRAASKRLSFCLLCCVAGRQRNLRKWQTTGHRAGCRREFPRETRPGRSREQRARGESCLKYFTRKASVRCLASIASLPQGSVLKRCSWLV